MFFGFHNSNFSVVSEILPGQYSLALQEPTPGPQLNASLSNWKSVVSMMFSNASPMNFETVSVLASLLIKSGHIEAAHICHLLFGTGAFGTENGNKPSYELLGSELKLPGGFGRDLDSVLLSLVMEYYKISMEPTLPVTPYCPHLVLHKLNLVSYLIDCGNLSEAQVLLDIVSGIVKAAGKNINYPASVFSYLSFVSQRLNHSNQDDTSSSWITAKIGRPKLDKMLGHLDKSFSKFVTGDDNNQAPLDQDGPFKRLAETPAGSRAQSTVDLTSMSKQPYVPIQSSSYSGNPYGTNDISGQDFQNYQHQATPSRSQSSVGFNSNISNFSPPQPVIQRGVRPYSPSYGISRGPSEISPSFDLMARPGSSSTSRSRGSSMTYQDQYIPHQPESAQSYGGMESRPFGAEQMESKNQVQSAPTSASVGILENPATTPVNPYAPIHTAGAVNPYSPSSNLTSSPAVSNASAAHIASSPYDQNNSMNSYSASSSAVPLTTGTPQYSDNGSEAVEAEMSKVHSYESASAKPSTASVHNPYGPAASTPQQPKSNPYAPSSDTSKSYAPSSYDQPSSRYTPAQSHQPLESPSSTSAPVPAPAPAPAADYGGYNPYGSAFGYNAGEPLEQETPEYTPNPEAPVQEEQLQEEQNSGYDPNAYGSYEPPQYGVRADDVYDEPAQDDSYDPEGSGEVFAPMGAPTFMPAVYTPMSGSNTSVIQNTVLEEEDEEIEDLGFSNNSMKKKEDFKSKEEEDKEEATLKEKKSGWFSWIRKGDSGEKTVKATQIKFGDQMSLVYDPVLKRYVNKNAPKEDLKPAPATAPPPPMGGPMSFPNTPPVCGSSMPPTGGMPPSRTGSAQPPASTPMLSSGSSPSSARTTPSIPTSGGLDDLLAAAPSAGGARKAGRRNARSRYVDIVSQAQPPS